MHVNSWETGRTHHLCYRFSSSLRHLPGIGNAGKFWALRDYFWKLFFPVLSKKIKGEWEKIKGEWEMRTDGFLWDEEIPLQTYEGTVKRILIFTFLREK